jgi:hypothetical protein
MAHRPPEGRHVTTTVAGPSSFRAHCSSLSKITVHGSSVHLSGGRRRRQFSRWPSCRASIPIPTRAMRWLTALMVLCYDPLAIALIAPASAGHRNAARRSRSSAEARGRRRPAEADLARTAHPNSIVAITVIDITGIPVVDARCETIPIKIGRTPERSREKPAVLEKDRSGEKTVLPAAKMRWETHVNPSPAIPALRNSVRWFHDYQRSHRSEKCDALQHESLLYVNAALFLATGPPSNRKNSIGIW